MSSSTKIDNRKKDILILGISPTQGKEHALSVEKMCSSNFTENKKKVCAHIIIEQVVFHLLMVRKFIKLKQKILKL